jgi:SpoVK/Ycf46/Vps4 family AAA+-type ATPase
LPDHETREKLLAINLKDIPLNDDVKSNLNFIAEKLERYSGSDITSVCR